MSDSNDVVAGSGDGDVDVNGKLDHVRDGTPSSMDSSPEPDAIGEATQEPTQPQKRKGGRKPIYATSEERKQRNRQAQAAFRERRTEYIKQLEATIKQNEDSLATLQQSHRSAADECLMLRYKNSLLERILLERGIDVQAELQMKTGSPAFPSGFMQPMPNIAPARAPPLQRTALQRQHARRSGQALTPKLPIGPAQHTTSPHAVPTPSSHVSSPSTISTRSPVALAGGTTPPTSAVLAQPQGQPFQHFPRSQQPPPSHSFYPPHPQRQPPRSATTSSAYQSSTSGVSSQSPNSQGPGQSTGRPESSGGNGSALTTASTYYPSPFQTHIDKLEQEYDTQHASHSMLDEPEHDADQPDGPNHLRQHSLSGAYPTQHPYAATSSGQQGFGYQHGHPSAMPPPGQQRTPLSQYEMQQGAQALSSLSGGGDGGAFGTLPHMIDPNDPMLDADPFGLSASMHYPTAYSFDPSGR